MATTAKRLFGPAQLTNAAATKYTVPAGTKTKVRHVHFCNPGAATTITCSLGADAAGTRLLDAMPIPASSPYDWYPYMVMDAAEIIQAFAGVTNQVTMTIFGDELTLG
jgi:hypothetical protein